MQVHYKKKSLVSQVHDAIAEASAKGKEIECITLCPIQFKQILDELGPAHPIEGTRGAHVMIRGVRVQVSI